jgi:SAM-dependent methyltransferase
VTSTGRDRPTVDDGSTLDDLARNWQAFGEQDPLWAIATAPDKQGGGWDTDAFFERGRVRFADLVTDRWDELGAPAARRRALDFGCGVGRFTRAMTAYFDRADGVDVAESMIAQARELNAGIEGLEFHVNQRDDLALFDDDSFDLVFSVIVLQHVGPELAVTYVRELARVLVPGGLLVFQMPHARDVAPPLPAEACRGRVEIVDAPKRVASGTRFTTRVRLTNRSDEIWPSASATNLGVGNHWLSATGEVLVADDGRRYLDLPLEPGASASLDLPCLAPSTPGPLLLEVDAIQEGVCWFATTGNETARVAIDVDDAAVEPTRPAAREAAAADPIEPHMEMHAVPRAEMLAVLDDAGVQVLRVDDDRSAGPDWLSTLYYATKP